MSTSSSPAATASSTTYWIAGLSTTGSISFGVALVAGRNRVPSPAAGMTALRTTAPLMVTTLDDRARMTSGFSGATKADVRATSAPARSARIRAERSCGARAIRRARH